MLSPDAASFQLTYRVCPQQPAAHLFGVELRIAHRPAGTLVLALPAWCPGSYMIRDFARHLVRITAVDSHGRTVPIIKQDKQTWALTPGDALMLPLIVSYQMYAWDFSVRAAYLDSTRAYFNGPSLLLQVRGFEHLPCRIDLLPPPAGDCLDWRLATSLKPLAAAPLGFGAYQADDYADLIDHPVEMGRFDLASFTVRSVPHRFAVSGRQRCDFARIQRDLERICGQHAALFGELPIDRYLFLAVAASEGYGGLEHRFSSSLLCTRDDLPSPGEAALTAGYQRFLGLCSHEYFHLWHVKRIQPLCLLTAGLTAEIHTRLLWVFEGITSYYDDLALIRSGCIEPTAYLQLLAENVTRVMRTPGRLVQTLAESSFDAWTKFYKQDENAPNAIISYYAKGALVALALDLTIRRETDGRVALDDVMRALWVRHGRTGLGVPELGFETLAMEVSGLDLGDFFAQALDSTDDLDLASLLASVGILMRLRPAIGPKDQGGCVERFEPIQGQPTLAVRLRNGGPEAVLAHVLSGGAGECAGLAPGDQVVAVNGLRATAENLERLVAASQDPHGAPMPIRLHCFRRNELLELTACPQPAVADTCELILLDAAPEAMLRARTAWLASLV
jgi:predicted metalloprotease with PDZ domain